ncbi:hypothetical protein QTQ03_25290 [Micromonospora sp. WMMA1363]|uniref:hypothetical protein n=1 Tax=Micromonospora sp. WMMA1363 TaxID=3053985 RepID=UPI00259CBD3A|nr:hypothetical protein [Micromonospora sp. WMMA1363]MDM4722750.1 hypothetical protein [Micromonospora sp. WMMA1363]
MPNTAVVLKTTHLTLNSVDISDWCSKIELTTEVDEKDVTTFGSAGWMEVLGGLAKGTLAVTFKNDYVDNELDEDLWAIFGTVVTFATRPTSASASTNNPSYSGSVLIKELKPVNGSVGDVAEMDVSWPTSGAVSRATS